MNTAVYKIAEGVACQACGGVLARVHKNEFGLCGSCWTSVELTKGLSCVGKGTRNHGQIITDADVTQWLASRLERDAKRLSATGIIGRCEAISGWAYGSPGTQCAKSATERRDGHIVCYRHAHATSPQYVRSETSDPYIRLSEIIRVLCDKEERFARLIADVAASLRGKS